MKDTSYFKYDFNIVFYRKSQMLLEKEWEIVKVTGKGKLWKDCAIYTRYSKGFSLVPSYGSGSQNKPYLFKLESVGVPDKKNSYKIKALSEKPGNKNFM